MEKCGICNSTNIFSGSWAPGRCRHCGASEVLDEWYYDTDAKPTIKELRKKSGYMKKKKSYPLITPCRHDGGY